MTGARADWPRRAGRTVLAAGVAAWAWQSLGHLPVCYSDLHYLFSLEYGWWFVGEVAHPAFVPLLGLGRRVLASLGHGGGMLMPLSYLNLLAGLATLGLLYREAERVGGRPWVAAFAVLLLGFTPGFWQGTLRPDPYALAGLCVAASLAMLLRRLPSAAGTPPPPASGERLAPARTASPGPPFAALGVVGGLALGFHAGTLFLAPAAGWAAWRSCGSWSRWARAGGRYLAGLATTLLLGYVALAWYHGIGLDELRRLPSWDLFGNLEAVRGTSIYSSGDWLKQARDFASTLRAIGAVPWCVLAGALACARAALGLSRPRARPGPEAAARWEAVGVTLVCQVSCAAFFLVNNTDNGFVYAVLLPMPILAAALAADGPAFAGLFVCAAAVLAWAGSSQAPPSAKASDALYVETRFLDGLLGRGDAVVVPGCPFQEVLYERRFNVLPVAELIDARHPCRVPTAGLASLPASVEARLRRGRKVYFARGGVPPDVGAQRAFQIFEADIGPPSAAALAVRAVERRLSDTLRMECGLRSPQGWEYCRLRLKPGGRGGPARAAGPPRPSTARELECLLREMPGGPEFLDGPRSQVRYLLDWLEEAPDDEDVRADILASIAGRVRSSPLGSPGERERMAAVAGALTRMRPDDVGLRIDLASILTELGRRPEALAALAAAGKRGPGWSAAETRRAAWAYQALGECRRALALWSALVREGGAGGKDYSDRAVCEYMTGDLNGAVADLRRAIRLSPGLAESYASLGAAYGKLGEHGKAVETFERGLAIGGEERLQDQLRTGLAQARARLAGRRRDGKEPRPLP